jgi:hypothetical protein
MGVLSAEWKKNHSDLLWEEKNAHCENFIDV